MQEMDKWQKEIDRLSYFEENAVNKKLFRYYRQALIDIKKEMKVFMDNYENLSFSKRLEAERLLENGKQIDKILRDINGQVNNTIEKYIHDSAERGYYGSWYAMEGANNIQLDMNMLPEDYIKQLVHHPVKGKVFSKRLYSYTNKLAKQVTTSLLDAARTGKSYAVAAKNISEMTEATYKRAFRIARTEGGRVQSTAKQRSYVEAKKKGVDLKKKWLSTLDNNTRDTHQGLDGQVVEIEEQFESLNGNKADGPRLFGVASEDINCRCTTITEVNGMSPELRRDNEGNEFPYKNYDEWYNKRIEEQERSASDGDFGANLDYVRSKEYRDEIANESRLSHIADEVANTARRMLQHRNGTPFEDYYLLDSQSGKTVAISNKARKTKGVVYNNKIRQAFKDGEHENYISIHNHPSSFPPSLSDIASLGRKNKNNTVDLGVVAGHDGSIYWHTKPNKAFGKNDNSTYNKLIEQNVKLGYNEIRAQEIALGEFAKRYDFKFGKVGD
ncbi:phage minor head protein [Amphibacillus sp. Q70]|uniref:phage minor head protein n=1 Tax=Amphibacillus sp. Q70 TaxID=3453416 RepID=UPI003F82FB38